MVRPAHFKSQGPGSTACGLTARHQVQPGGDRLSRMLYTACSGNVMKPNFSTNRSIAPQSRQPFTRYALAICMFTACVAAFGEELPTAKPESVGLSAERLERIAAAVDRSIAHKRIAGAVTLG